MTTMHNEPRAEASADLDETIDQDNGVNALADLDEDELREIAAAAEKLAREEGLYVEPASAGAVAAVAQLLQGDLDIFARVLNGLFDTAKTGFDISLGLVGVMSLWLGVMKIGERGGLIQLFGRVVTPFFRRVFPDIPAGHPASVLYEANTGM